MARQTKEVTVGSERYRITQLGGEEGSELFDSLVIAVGPAIVANLEGLAKKLTGASTENEKAVVAALVPVVVETLAKVPLDLRQRLRKAWLQNTVVIAGSAELNMATAQLFDQHFAGRQRARHEWEFAHFSFNFLADFLPSKPKSANSEPGAK